MSWMRGLVSQRSIIPCPAKLLPMYIISSFETGIDYRNFQLQIKNNISIKKKDIF